jgi:mono/diheme cytochrome c family protein
MAGGLNDKPNPGNQSAATKNFGESPGAVLYLAAMARRLNSKRSCGRALFSAVLLGAATTFAPAVTPPDASRLPPPATRAVDFQKDIQPLLANHCYECHGPKKQQAELRWDTKESALKGGEHGPAIVLGKSAESLMIHLVGGLREDLVMPQKGPRLTAEQVGLLRAWIDQGANWPDDTTKASDLRDHWSFKAPGRPAVPAVKNSKWPRNPIDHFILARLEKEKLKPSPEANRATLIRRLSLDLTGLPPTIAEIEAFLNDRSRDACEKVVERLLRSPHYGERWGRHWLDAARYADSNGFEKDLARNIWPYRDWIINAFNRDLPFDQFTIEQLAGDLLPNPTLAQRVATGFLRNSMLNEEGGVDPEQFRFESLVDRMDAIGKAFLGLTINCAQCHNHKFDPVSQQEYYRLFAFLNNDDEPEIEVPNDEQAAKRAEILAGVAKIEADLMAKDSGWRKRMATWEREMNRPPVKWTVLEPESWFAAVGVKFEKFKDGSLLAKADRFGKGTYEVNTTTQLKGITGFRIELLTDPNLPFNGPGRSKDGMCVLTEFEVIAQPVGGPSTTNKVELVDATADFETGKFPAIHAINGIITNGGWGIDAGAGQRNVDRHAVFQTEVLLGFDEGTKLHFTLHQNQGDILTIGRFRISATTSPDPKADPLPPKLRRLLAIPAEQRSLEQQRALFSFYRATDPQFAEANKQTEELWKQWPSASTTLALSQRKEPRETHVHKRGDFLKPTVLVTAGVPAVLHPLTPGSARASRAAVGATPTASGCSTGEVPVEASGTPALLSRLDFARWLADRRNPLTPRVIANRIWQGHFGTGLVATPEDFGTQGERPSHPELLDWLACEFITRGWSVKEMHRLIVSSATYRQSSRVTPEFYSHDPFNRLLARAPRLRVESETVRDITLATSGLLNPKLGGPSVYPPIPEGVLALGYNVMKWPTEFGDNRYRRSLYTFWKRSVPYPALLVFDTPNGDFSCARRTRSNTPLQALTTLNERLFIESAQALALRVLNERDMNDRERLVLAFRLCTGRKPEANELHPLLNLLADQTRSFDRNEAPATLVAAPDPINPPKLPPGTIMNDVAAWTMVCRVILNLDETITRE